LLEAAAPAIRTGRGGTQGKPNQHPAGAAGTGGQAGTGARAANPAMGAARASFYLTQPVPLKKQ
jgi:hypothetical protein